MDPERKFWGLIEEGEDRVIVHRAADLPPALLTGVDDLGLDEAQEILEILAGHEVTVHWAEQTDST